MKSIDHRFWALALLAIAFAYVEATVVVYLRGWWGIEDLILDIPPLDRFIAACELGREVATLVLLLAAGWAVGKTTPSRWGFAFFAFGLWDLFYYVWLKVLLGWPNSLLEPDILFLVPLPWWGPVLSPVLIAILCIVGGTFAVVAEERGKIVRPTKIQWMVTIIGIAIALYTFMADAIALLPATADELNELRPTTFHWPLYLVGLIAMAWPVLTCTWPGGARDSDDS
jgi:hypothetical protein